MKNLCRATCTATSRRGGFALIEVIITMVILGIAMATMMRSFTLSMSAIRKNDATTDATILAENLLQNIEADPPRKTRRNEVLSGDFGSQGSPEFSYDVKITDEKIKYRLKTTNRVEGLRDLKVVTGNINYEDPNKGTIKVADVYLILSPFERYSYESKFRNELFSAEEGIE